jgi:uncharacterized protein YbjT (DUF2867 family)
MKVVVTAPAGHVGSRVARLLIQAGVRPTLLARNPGRLDSGIADYADVTAVDLAEAAAVVRATRGPDALFWVEPSTADPDADPVAWYTALGANAARAMTENDIGRTVFLSSTGAEMRSGAGEIGGLASPAGLVPTSPGWRFVGGDDAQQGDLPGRVQPDKERQLMLAAGERDHGGHAVALGPAGDLDRSGGADQFERELPHLANARGR